MVIPATEGSGLAGFLQKGESMVDLQLYCELEFFMYCGLRLAGDTKGSFLGDGALLYFVCLEPTAYQQ